MSYILDALRRADNERERDRSAPPGLNSQMQAPASTVEHADDDEAASAGASRPWAKLVLGLMLGLVLGALAWWWMGGQQRAAPVDPVAAVTPLTGSQPLPQPPPGGPPPVVPGVVGGPAVPAALGPTANSAVEPAPSASSPVLVPLPAVLPDPKKKPPPPGSGSKESAERKPSPKPAIQPQEPGSSERPKQRPRPPAATADDEASSVRAFSQLPEAVRRELPPLAVSGSMYSPEPGARMLVLDGQVVREGDQPKPGLSIDAIGPKSATLSYRGERFRLNY